MSRPRICPMCKKRVTKEESYEYKKKYYHEECFIQFSKKINKEEINKKKKKQELEKTKKNIQKDTHISIETDLTDRDILAKEQVILYLKKLLNLNKLNVKTYKLLKDYYTVYKFSYEGMLITLKYFYETQDNPIISDCVGIIPYVYEEAQEYEKIKRRISKEAEKLDMEKIVIEKIVKVNKNNAINNKLIDIEELR